MTKRILWVCSLALLSSVALADDGSKTAIDGTKVQKITFDGDKVTVKYNNGTADATFDMADVIISFSGTLNMEERVAMSRKLGLEGQKIYNLKGQYVGRSAAHLQPGIYIVGGKKIRIQ